MKKHRKSGQAKQLSRWLTQCLFAQTNTMPKAQHRKEASSAREGGAWSGPEPSSGHQSIAASNELGQLPASSLRERMVMEGHKHYRGASPTSYTDPNLSEGTSLSCLPHSSQKYHTPTSTRSVLTHWNSTVHRCSRWPNFQTGGRRNLKWTM